MQFGSDSPTSFPTFRQQEGKWKKQKKNMNYLIDVLNILKISSSYTVIITCELEMNCSHYKVLS